MHAWLLLHTKLQCSISWRLWDPASRTSRVVLQCFSSYTTIADKSATSTGTYSSQLRIVNRFSSCVFVNEWFCIYTAPPSPRNVSAVLATPVILTVTWSRPARVRGTVIFYTVYAIPFVSQVSPSARKKRQADTNLGTIAKVHNNAVLYWLIKEHMCKIY